MRVVDQSLSAYLRRFHGQHMVLDLSINEAPEFQRDKPYLLYIHIPFCESLCPFCSFHRVLFKEQKAHRYFAALNREIHNYHSQGLNVAEVYVGGGTPTVMPRQLSAMLQQIRQMWGEVPISVETNPNHLHDHYLAYLDEAGVNRLSVGVQSFDNRLLKAMGRYQSYGSGEQIRQRLQQVSGRFDTLNVDMIFNIPHQDEASLLQDLQWVVDAPIDQVSYYPLMPATTTQHAMSKQMGEVNFEREREYFQLIQDTLEPQYQPTSVWCFARNQGAIDEYIVNHDEYIGAGSGAISYVNGGIYSSTFSLNNYIDLIAAGGTGLTARRQLNGKEQAQYDFLMRLFGLRMDKQQMQDKYDGEYFKLIRKEKWLFQLLGALRDRGKYLELTREGRYFWLVMMREFFMGVNNFRCEMRAQIRAERDRIPELNVAGLN
ncbi:MAG: coproporphyrinogen III oxidase family protein [Gammaproteobacteria bacterium]